MNVSDKYTLGSYGPIDTYGYIYENNFDPFSPSKNLLAMDDDSGSGYQFKLVALLQVDITYVLVVTTYSSRRTGAFSIYVPNANSIILKYLSEYTYVI